MVSIELTEMQKLWKHLEHCLHYRLLHSCAKRIKDQQLVNLKKMKRLKKVEIAASPFHTSRDSIVKHMMMSMFEGIIDRVRDH